MKCKATHWTSNQTVTPFCTDATVGAERSGVWCAAAFVAVQIKLWLHDVLSPAIECRYRLSYVWFSPSFISASTSRITFIHMCPTRPTQKHNQKASKRFNWRHLISLLHRNQRPDTTTTSNSACTKCVVGFQAQNETERHCNHMLFAATNCKRKWW